MMDWIVLGCAAGAAAISVYLFFGAYHYRWRRRNDPGDVENVTYHLPETNTDGAERWGRCGQPNCEACYRADDLRDRIAAVLYRLCWERQGAHSPWEQLLEIEREAWRDDADAVIRELGLRQEQLGEDAGYPHPSHRFVTDWIADE